MLDAERKLRDIGRLLQDWQVQVAMFESAVVGAPNSVEYRVIKDHSEKLAEIMERL